MNKKSYSKLLSENKALIDENTRLHFRVIHSDEVLNEYHIYSGIVKQLGSKVSMLLKILLSNSVNDDDYRFISALTLNDIVSMIGSLDSVESKFLYYGKKNCKNT